MAIPQSLHLKGEHAADSIYHELEDRLILSRLRSIIKGRRHGVGWQPSLGGAERRRRCDHGGVLSIISRLSCEWVEERGRNALKGQLKGEKV